MRRGIIATAGILYEGLSRLGAGDTISPEVINYSTYPKYPASDTYLLPGPYGSMNPDPRKEPHALQLLHIDRMFHDAMYSARGRLVRLHLNYRSLDEPLCHSSHRRHRGLV